MIESAEKLDLELALLAAAIEAGDPKDELMMRVCVVIREAHELFSELPKERQAPYGMTEGQYEDAIRDARLR